jgi:DNA adenine methylase
LSKKFVSLLNLKDTVIDPIPNTPTRPFLRWAGGKQWLVKTIEEFLPDSIQNYYEPFLGGGSVFIFLKSNNLINGKAYLSDVNSELINCYQAIQSSTEDLISELKAFKNDSDFYYLMRDKKYRNHTKKSRTLPLLEPNFI